MNCFLPASLQNFMISFPFLSELLLVPRPFFACASCPLSLTCCFNLLCMQVACLPPTSSHVNAALVTINRGDFDAESSFAFLNIADGLK